MKRKFLIIFNAIRFKFSIFLNLPKNVVFEISSKNNKKNKTYRRIYWLKILCAQFYNTFDKIEIKDFIFTMKKNLQDKKKFNILLANSFIFYAIWDTLI